ncbi:HAD-IA family hydrolase [Kineococcus sp. R8]|uniref:HAD-IA family hydrolase n=1 Tax=Kineococcus siccus TaxID=2696567 RepID=UPI00141253BC|nr:HAD-IA family hydrolase [Kineococcus siccus]NAZ82473.1 HAD-IA family hydrolase [Kineococcus siccus]
MSDRVLRAEAVLFDCDGVLVDSDASVTAAWSRWSRDEGLDPVAVVAQVHGRRAADTVAALVAARGRAAALERIDRYELEAAAEVTAVPGAAELTAALPAGRWAVVTSGTRALATARLAAAGLPAPAVVVTADDVRVGKPDPEGYRLAARLLGVEPGRCVVVEDAASGVAAARAAGVAAVVGVGKRALATDADVVVRDLREVDRVEAAAGVRGADGADVAGGADLRLRAGRLR